jgi:CHAD domain-containing protein
VKEPSGARSPDLAALLKRQTRRLESLLDKPRKAASGKRLHQLRVLTRKIRALLWLAWGEKAPKAPARLEWLLDRLARRLGKLRTLEVALLDAKRFHLKLPKIKEQLKRDRKNLRLRSATQQRLESLARESRRDLKRHPPSLGLLRRRVLGLSRALLAAPNPAKRDLHPIRIELKRLRYALEALGLAEGKLPLLLAALGELHDLEALEKMAGPNEALIRQQKALAQKVRDSLAPSLRELAAALAS